MLSDRDRLCAEMIQDLYEVSCLCSTTSYIWGGVSVDISRGSFVREHHDVDAFTVGLRNLIGPMTRHFEQRGYSTTYLPEFNALKASKGGCGIGLNQVDVNGEIAMWRHVGNEGTIYFPSEWLDVEPRDFLGIKTFTAGERFEYCIKAYPRLMSPEWEPRPKDIEAREYLRSRLESQQVDPEALLGQIWSFTPYWLKRGYKAYAMPVVAVPLFPP